MSTQDVFWAPVGREWPMTVSDSSRGFARVTKSSITGADGSDGLVPAAKMFIRVSDIFG